MNLNPLKQIVVVCALSLVASLGVAQDSSTAQQSDKPISPEPAGFGEYAELNKPPLEAEDLSLMQVTRPISFAALDNGPVVVLREHNPLQFTYGAGYALTLGDTLSGLDNSYIKGSNTILPYFAVTGSAGRELFVGQYSGTFTDYSFTSNTSSSPLSAYHSGQFAVIGNVNSSWTWTASENVNYGNGVLRSIAPLPGVASGLDSLLDPSAANLLVNTSTVFGTRTEFKTDWRQSERQMIHFSFQHAYYKIDGEASHMNETAFEAQVDRIMSRRWSLTYYGQVITPVVDPGCVSVGAGLGAEVRLSRSSLLNVEGGPQFTRKNCERPQGLNYSAQYLKNIGQHAALYASARRQRTSEQDNLATLALWEDGAAVGVRGDLPWKLLGRVDWGYAHGNVLRSSDSYQSNLISAGIQRRVTKYLMFDVSYRNYYNEQGPANVNRNAVIFAIYFKHEPSERQ